MLKAKILEWEKKRKAKAIIIKYLAPWVLRKLFLKKKAKVTLYVYFIL